MANKKTKTRSPEIQVGDEVQFTATNGGSWQIATFLGLLPDGRIAVEGVVPLYDQKTVHEKTKDGAFEVSALWRYVPEQSSPVTTWSTGTAPLSSVCEPAKAKVVKKYTAKKEVPDANGGGKLPAAAAPVSSTPPLVQAAPPPLGTALHDAAKGETLAVQVGKPRETHATWNVIGILIWHPEPYDPVREAPPHRTAIACDWTQHHQLGDLLASDAMEILEAADLHEDDPNRKEPQNGLPTCLKCQSFVEQALLIREERILARKAAEMAAEDEKRAEEKRKLNACEICELTGGQHEDVCPNKAPAAAPTKPATGLGARFE